MLGKTVVLILVPYKLNLRRVGCKCYSLYSTIQFLYSKCHKIHRYPQMINAFYYAEMWHILRSREHWWVGAISADSSTRMCEGNFCMIVGYLLPLLSTPAFFSSRDHGDALAAHQDVEPHCGSSVDNYFNKNNPLPGIFHRHVPLMTGVICPVSNSDTNYFCRSLKSFLFPKEKFLHCSSYSMLSMLSCHK